MTLAELRAQAVRVWQAPDGAFCRTHPGMIHTHTILPAPVAERLLALAEACEAYGAALRTIDAPEWHDRVALHQDAMLAALAAVKGAKP